MSLIIFLVFALCCYVLFKHFYISLRFPPGKPRFPLIGTIPSRKETGSRGLLTSVKLIPKYGDIIGIFAGPTVKIVFVQDFAKAKELAVNDDFLGRYGDSLYAAELRGHNNQPTGVALTEGPIWKHLRRFSLATLKEFGFGKKSIGSIIEEEALDLVIEDLLKNSDDLLVDNPFNIAVFNSLWRIVASKRFERNDEQVKNQVALLSEVFKTAFMELGLPFIFRLFPSLTGYDVKKKHVALLKKMMAEEIERHQRQLIPGEPKDFIDVYLEAMETDPLLSLHHLTGICMDFFEAGGETVGSTLSWMLMYMALNPDVQTKCREEIDRVVGMRNVTLDDKPNLPYLEATIMEVQRVSCVAPAGLEHRALKDVNYHGYFLPKGTLVFYNIYWFHMNPEYWGDPEVFRPERFIHPETGSVIRHERFVPFGFGKRICMGESLAKAELFLFTSTLLKNGIIEKPEHHQIPDPNNDVCGFTRSPEKFYVKIRPRK